MSLEESKKPSASPSTATFSSVYPVLTSPKPQKKQLQQVGVALPEATVPLLSGLLLSGPPVTLIRAHCNCLMVLLCP